MKISQKKPRPAAFVLIFGAWTYKPRSSWKKNSKGWYNQDTAGWYAKKGTWKIDGKNYNFDAKGYCTNP
ncbi:MAG: hypothetical protein K5665_01990 [Saccharofermentans sp.]|nr:hypothetical protein [Saccharofermentans sp.]